MKKKDLVSNLENIFNKSKINDIDDMKKYIFERTMDNFYGIKFQDWSDEGRLKKELEDAKELLLKSIPKAKPVDKNKRNKI